LVGNRRSGTIRKARADLEVAKAEARNAEITYQRIKGLAERDVLPKQDLDNATATLDTANARVRAAEETLNLAVAGPREEDIAEAKATLRANEAALALAQRELDDARLFAPADGIIRDRTLEPGDMATPQKTVYTLALTDPLWVRAYVSEPDLGKIRPGMKAEIHTDSFPSKEYDGWIGYLSPTAEFTPKSVETTEVRSHLVYQVRVFVKNPQGELRLGMPATVMVPLDQPVPAKEPGTADAAEGH